MNPLAHRPKKYPKLSQKNLKLFHPPPRRLTQRFTQSLHSVQRCHATWPQMLLLLSPSLQCKSHAQSVRVVGKPRRAACGRRTRRYAPVHHEQACPMMPFAAHQYTQHDSLHVTSSAASSQNVAQSVSCAAFALSAVVLYHFRSVPRRSASLRAHVTHISMLPSCPRSCLVHSLS